MTEREQKVFGMSENEIRTQYMQSLTAELTGMEMVVMGVLSDAQEMMEDKLLQSNSRKVHAV